MAAGFERHARPFAWGDRGFGISVRGGRDRWGVLRALFGKMGFSLMKGRKSAPAESERPAKRCPPPPSWLSPHAKKEWKRAAKELHGRKLLADDVLATLESYCVAVGLVRECEELMAKEGRIVASESGPKPHPAFRMQQAAMREVRLYAAELGLTPHRRGAKGGESEDDNGGWDSDLLS